MNSNRHVAFMLVINYILTIYKVCEKNLSDTSDTYYTFSTPSVVTSVDYIWSEPNINCTNERIPQSVSLSDFQTRATNVYSVRHLDQIITKKEKIKFSYHIDNSYKIMQKILDTIQITDLLNNETTLIAVLSHDKFQGDARLQLTGVQIAGADFTDSKTFTFDYQSGSLPGYGSYKRDIFGYQNNNSEWHMIPRGAGADPTYFRLNAFANREVDTTRILYGILNKLTYPTGGSVKYYYEPNMEERSGAKYYAPGVRVKKIEFIESNDKVIKEELFTYSGLTSAQVHEMGLYPFHYLVRDAQSVSPAALYSERTFSSNPIKYNNKYNGLYYHNVISKVLGEPTSAGYTMNNHDGYLDNFTLQPYLTSQRFVDSENNTVKKVEYFYLDSVINEIHALSLDLSWTFYGLDYDCGIQNYRCSGGMSCPEFEIHYKPLRKLVYTSTEFTKTKETTTEYFNGSTDSICTEQYYYYDISSHLNVDYILQTGVSRYSKTSIETSLIDSTAIKYPKDYTFTGFPDNLENSYIIGIPIDTRLYKDVGGSSRLVAGKTTEYNNYGQPVKEYLWEGDILSSEEWVSNNLVNAMGGFKLRLSYTYDNSTHNLTSYTQKDNITTSFLWGYNDLLPIAEVINANHGRFAYTGFEENGVFGGWTYQSGTRVSTYARTGKYSCANAIMQRRVTVNSIVSLWAKTGSGTVTITGYTPKIYASTDGWTYYEWKVNPPLIFTVNCSNGYIDDLRLYPVGALMTTYTYNPLIGMSSMTDHNGIITRYEYDSFGRLKNVRDNDGKITARNYYHYYNDPLSDTPYLNTSPTSLSFGSSASSSNLSISSNSTWSITDNATWLSVNTTSGTGYATISATVTTNTGAARNATITITYTGGLTKTVSVSQAACSSTLTVNRVGIDFGSIAPTVTVTVTSNTSWTVTQSDWWIRLSATSGTGNGTVGIGAAELPYEIGLPSEVRTGTVTFKTTDNTVTRIIEITQVPGGL